MLATQSAGTNTEQALDCGTALTRVLEVFNLRGPLRALMVVEDPGAANFAAGFLPALNSRGTTAIYAKGQGAAQLSRLGVNAMLLDIPFDANTLLARTQPGMVVVGTSEDKDAAAHDVVVACRNAHIPTLGFVDGPANIENRFRGHGVSATSYAPDAVLVPTEKLRNQFIAVDFPSDRIFIVTHPHFLHIAAEKFRLDVVGRYELRRRIFPNCPAGRPVVVFLAERSNGFDPGAFMRNAEYTLNGRSGDNRRTNIVLEEVLEAVARLEPRPYVVLRLHSKNDPSEFAAYEPEIDWVSSSEPALELVYAADLVIGMTTMLLTEAATLGVPSLSVTPRACERDWLLAPPNMSIPAVHDRAALSERIRSMLSQLCGQSAV
jgi:hypothetical protein